MRLLFDIGGTHLRLATTTNGLEISQPLIFPTPQRFDDAMELFKEQSRTLAGDSTIEAICGGIAGPLNKEKSMVVHAPHLPGWNNQPIKTTLASMFNVSVYLENDASLCGLGEATEGPGKDSNIVMYLTISTGVGGTRIVDKKIDHSASGFEPGHQIIGLNNTHDLLRLENLISGSSLHKRYGMPPEDIKEKEVWHNVAKWLAIGIYNSVVHWSPELCILGGSTMKSIDMDIVEQHFHAIKPSYIELPRLVRSKLGDKSGLIGAMHYLNYTVDRN